MKKSQASNIIAPKGVSEDRKKQLEEEYNSIFKKPDSKEHLQNLFYDPRMYKIWDNLAKVEPDKMFQGFFFFCVYRSIAEWEASDLRSTKEKITELKAVDKTTSKLIRLIKSNHEILFGYPTDSIWELLEMRLAIHSQIRVNF